jgi:hypothetical protein
LPLPVTIQAFRFERFAHGGFERPACQDQVRARSPQTEVPHAP